MRSRRSLELICCLTVLVFGILCQVRAETIILHLKNGDRLAGTIVREDTNQVFITTTWIKELPVPLDQIVSREKGPPELAGTNAPPVLPSVTTAPGTNAPAPTNTLQTATSTNVPLAISTNAPVAVVSNTVPVAGSSNAVVVSSNVVAKVTPSAPVKPVPPSRWKGEIRVGADFIFNANNQQNYYGRFKLTYERPYTSNPKKFFRNILDYSAAYGRTEGVTSANQMNGSDKMDFDIYNRWYVYNLGAVGYDQVRKIDLLYEIGPGIGYHLLTLTNFVMDVEAGVNYQAQYRSDNTSNEKFYYRLAEIVTWKLNKRFTFTEKAEYSPQVEEVAQYRARLEANLSYGIWGTVSLNVGLVDLYDTQPAKNVSKNDLQVRSWLGFTF